MAYLSLYTVFLVLAATNPENKEWFGQVILFAVVPLTVLTLGMSFLQSSRERRAELATSRRSVGEGRSDRSGSKSRRANRSSRERLSQGAR